MNMFGWWDEILRGKAPLLIPRAPAARFDPCRKVAPPGLDEIDFDKRIALWDSLIAASGGEDEGQDEDGDAQANAEGNAAVNDN